MHHLWCAEHHCSTVRRQVNEVGRGRFGASRERLEVCYRDEDRHTPSYVRSMKGQSRTSVSASYADTLSISRNKFIARYLPATDAVLMVCSQEAAVYKSDDKLLASRLYFR